MKTHEAQINRIMNPNKLTPQFKHRKSENDSDITFDINNTKHKNIIKIEECKPTTLRLNEIEQHEKTMDQTD